MGKLAIEDLAAIRERYRGMFNVRQNLGRVRITVHLGRCGISAGARTILASVMAEIERRRLDDVVLLTSGCLGSCNLEPMLTVDAGPPSSPVLYVRLTPEKVMRIFESHILDGRMLPEYTHPPQSVREL